MDLLLWQAEALENTRERRRLARRARRQMMASARASGAEREQVYAKLQLSMAALQLDKLQMELDRQAAAEDEDDNMMDGVDMELGEDGSSDDGDDSEAALVTELVQPQSRRDHKPKGRKHHGVRAAPANDRGAPFTSVVEAQEELEEAVSISTVFAGPAPQKQPFAGHRCASTRLLCFFVSRVARSFLADGAPLICALAPQS